MAAPKSILTSIRIPLKIKKEIKRLAKKEKRPCSFSSMAILLWKKSLKMK